MESMKKMKVIKKSGMELTAVAPVDKGDWEAQLNVITSGLGTIGMPSNAINTNTKCKAVHNITEELKVKNDIVKSIQKQLHNMERDQRSFMKVGLLDNTNLPTSMPSLLA
ncbi:MAG: hypothetical protein ACKPKO_08750, partial [Candidatus Fonsibacter sp.]